MSKKKLNQIHDKHFEFSPADLGLFFVGIGLVLFILTATTTINIIQILNAVETEIEFPTLGFFISFLSTIMLMAYGLLNIHLYKKKEND